MSAPPSMVRAFRRRAARLQLQRPALLPVLVTIFALAAQVALGRWRPEVAEPTPAELTLLSGTFALGMLTVFTLLAGVVAGFTFVIIGTLGANFTSQLSDPAIRAPRLWQFLAFSLAGTCCSVQMLVSPPAIREVFAVPVVCLLGSLATLAAHLHGVSLDANPAALLRRLTDNDTPPVGFAEWGQGRPIQVGLATVRAALGRRDGPTATAVTLEVVRACAQFQGALMRTEETILRDPSRTWGLVHIASVQSELRQWVDELDQAEVYTPGAFEAAGQLLVYPLIWEATLVARLRLEEGRNSEADVAEEDLTEPVKLLLGAGDTTPLPGRSEQETLIRRLTIRAAALRGSLAALETTCHAVERETEQAARRFAPTLSEAIVSDLVVTGARLAADYACHLDEFGPADRYETHLIATTNAALLKQFGALYRHASRSERIIDRARSVLGAAPSAGQDTGFARELLAIAH